MKIPRIENFTVGAQPISGGQVSSVPIADAGAGVRQTGAVISQASAHAADFISKLTEETNRIIADDALAQVKDYAIDLRLNPESGFLSLKGRNALDRPNGKDLLSEYNEYLDVKNQEILKTLKNERQKEIYQQGLTGIRQTFDQQIQSHLLQENRNYHVQASSSGITMAGRAFALSSSDEERDAALIRMETNLRRLQNIEGWDDETFALKAMEVGDNAVRLAVDDLMDSERFDEAAGLVEKYKDFASPNTILKARERINEAWRDSIINDAVSNIGRDGIVTITLPGNGQMSEVSPIQDTVNRIIRHESQGKADAKNKNSSAAGLGQFIDSTWLNMIKTYRPDVAEGRSREQVLALKTDPKLSREMTEKYVMQNSQRLQAAGLPVNVRNLYLMHFAGESKGIQILKSDPSASVASVLGDKAIRANGFLRGKTIKQTIEWAEKAMGVKGGSGLKTYTINTNDPEQMERDLRSIPKYARDETRSSLNRQLAVMKQAKQEQIASRDNAIMKMIEQGGINSVNKSIWTNLTAEERKRFTDFGQAVRTNNQQELFEKNKAVYYDLLLNPEKMNSMTEEQLQAKGIDIGFERASNLVGAKRKHEAAKLKGVESPIKVESSVIKSIANIYKIKMGNKAKPEDIQQYYDLAENVQNLAKTMSVNLGRPPTESELIEAARKMQADMVITEKGFFFDDKKPALLLGREDRVNADNAKGKK